MELRDVLILVVVVVGITLVASYFMFEMSHTTSADQPPPVDTTNGDNDSPEVPSFLDDIPSTPDVQPPALPE
jgi:hypothetical protein